MDFFGKVLHELEIGSVGDVTIFLFIGIAIAGAILLSLAAIGTILWLLIFHTLPMLVFGGICFFLWLINCLIKSLRKR
jgi:hypothetical protein